MVYLTMTTAIVAALESLDYSQLEFDHEIVVDELEHFLRNPVAGNPIDHTQIIAISKLLKSRSDNQSSSSPSHHLDFLLRGSRIYIPPPKPKAELVSNDKSWDLLQLFSLSVYSRRQATKI